MDATQEEKRMNIQEKWDESNEKEQIKKTGGSRNKDNKTDRLRRKKVNNKVFFKLV